MGHFYTALLAILISLLAPSHVESSLAAMSIDLGSQFIKVGLVKPGVPMEIVLNKESRRKTPNLVGIRGRDRFFGDEAQTAITRFPSAIYGNLMDLVGRDIDDDVVKLYQQRFPHLKLEKHANHSGIVIPFGEDKYSVETLLAMILGNARDFTEAYAEATVKDVVITVPAYFTQKERQVVEKAAQIARLNLLQLINDGTAVSLSYGVFRRKELTEQPQRLMIYDMGSSKTTATLVEYRLVKEDANEPRMTVLGVGYDRTLGGLEITLRLQKLLVEKFRQNYRTENDITSNERAMARLFKEAERVKHVLSANVNHFAQVEGLHEDRDMKVSRDELEHLLLDLVERIEAPIKKALEQARIKMGDFDQFVLMGAGTRVPKVQSQLQTVLGSKEIGRFLNTDEAAAMGAIFQAAHLSKSYKVKPFNVQELAISPTEAPQKVNSAQDDVKEAQSILEAFETAEKLARDRAVAENELEAFAFDASLLLEDSEFLKFSCPEEQDNLRREASRIRAWLEDDTDTSTRTAEFVENYQKLDELVRPVKNRQQESRTRPLAMKNLESRINSSIIFVRMGGEDEKALFHLNDTQALEKKLNGWTEWLLERKTEQAARKSHEEPAFTAEDVREKIKELDQAMRNFMRKIKTDKLEPEDLKTPEEPDNEVVKEDEAKKEEMKEPEEKIEL